LGELEKAMDGVLKTAKAVLLPGAIAALILYFSYHAIAGDQGLAAWGNLQQQEEKLLAQIEVLKADRASLEVSLERLRDRTLDLDYVEEIARTRLSYVRPDEVLVAVR
jgi:cell division protein FtsB